MENIKIPSHVGIIMDGNGRWAEMRGKNRSYGHKHGSANVDAIVTHAFESGVKSLTLYAFSCENWARPKEEVDELMKLLKILFFSKLTDLTNPVQVIPTNYEKNVIWKEKGFCTLIEHTIMPVRLGHVCLEVPAKCYPRTEGSSKNSAMRTALYMKTVLRVRFTPKSRLMKEKK